MTKLFWQEKAQLLWGIILFYCIVIENIFGKGTHGFYLSFFFLVSNLYILEKKVYVANSHSYFCIVLIELIFYKYGKTKKCMWLIAIHIFVLIKLIFYKYGKTSSFIIELWLERS